ncbi:MAG: tetratricopeptide repeat protein [Candidatus Hydrogenedentota bacterium]
MRVWGLCAILLLGCIAAYSQVSDDRDADEFYEDYEELWDQGEYQRALSALERIVDEQPRRYDKWIFRRAKLRFAVGRVDEAITDVQSVAVSSPQVWYMMEAALMNRYRGNMDEYSSWLARANSLFQSQRRFYSNASENLAATGYLLELTGENPKSIMSQLYTPYIEARRHMLSAAAHVGAGDLAYRASGYDVAEKHYLEALEKDESYQPALEGLMDSYWKSRDARLGEVIEHILSLNPNNPRVHSVMVRKHLDMGETDEALALIDKMLAINPVDTRFLGYKAAAHYLQYDDEAMQSTVERALAFNPVCSELYQTLGDIASRHYRFKDGLAFQEMALTFDEGNVEAREAYSLDLLRLGREAEGRRELERIFEVYPYSVATFNMLELMDTLEGFATVQRGDFTLKLPISEQPVMGDLALDLLDEAIELYEAKYEVELEKPVLIEMFDDHDDFMVRSVGLPGSVGHMGICFGKLITMDAPSVRPKGSSNWRSVLWHEFVHVITLQKTNNRMPRWLSEGISVYEENTYSTAFHNRLDEDYLTILAQEGQPDVHELEYLFTKAPSPGHLMFGYFMAGEFVNFYVEQYGFDALVDSLDAIGNKVSTNDALIVAASVSMEELNEAFHLYLDDRLEPLYTLLEPDEDSGTVKGFLQKQFEIVDPHVDAIGPSSPTLKSENSRHAVAMKKAGVAREEKDYDRALEALEEAYDLYPDYDGEHAPLRQMAEIYKEQQDKEGFIDVLERIVAWTPSELGATLELVQLYRETGDDERLGELGDWGIGIDPYSPGLQSAYMDGLLAKEDYAGALKRLDVLLSVDASNWVIYRYQKAVLLAKLDELDAAKREVLELLETVPNYWKAQEFLLKLNDETSDVEVEPLASNSTD